MIDCIGGEFYIVCDACNRIEEQAFYEHQCAVKFGKKNGWKTFQCGNTWVNVCPSCGNS